MMGTPKIKAPFNVFIDSDGPIADFDKDLEKSGETPEIFKHLPGTYLWLSPTKGAETSLNLLKHYDDRNELRVWVLTKTPTDSPYAYTEKVLWYRRNFPWLEDRVILTHDKSIVGNRNDFLLDDRPHKANALHFPGVFVFFDTVNPVSSWCTFLGRLEQRMESLAKCQPGCEESYDFTIKKNA